jgi:hypothetical protein
MLRTVSPALVTTVLLAALGACKFDPKGEAPDDGHPNGDGSGSDMMMIDSDPALCFGSGAFTVCLPSLPSGPRTLAASTITTDADQCNEGIVVDAGSGRPQLCVIAGTSVMVTGTIHARGSLPLVIIATDGDLRMQGGGIDVSSAHTIPAPGAGGSYGDCVASGNGNPDSNGAGGGAGGSFGTKGGNGGNGSGTSGGTAGDVDPAAFVRGGCRGGNGGAGMGGGALAGHGGGAVYLVAQNQLFVSGFVDASGSGGLGATQMKSGGGGGGSGGLIALYGKQGITIVDGTPIFANGGGGGAGAGSASIGGPGSESPAPNVIGGGGTGAATVGGNGAIDTMQGETPGTAPKGGSGGGGGVGVIKIVGGTITGTGAFSPPAT